MKKLILSLLLLVSINLYAQMSLVDYLNQPKAPINLKIVADPNLSVEANLVKNQPATLQLKGRDGTIYTLEIPAEAVIENATISMTEIKSHGDHNLNQTHASYGVVLAPSGYEFAKTAKLIINQAKAIPVNSLVPISGMHNGDDISLAMVDIKETANDKKVTLMINHFSTYSIMGSTTARETIFRAFNDLTKNRISSWASDQAIRSREGKPYDSDFFKKSLLEGFEKVVKPRLLNIESCEGASLAIQDYLSWTRQTQLLGFDLDLAGKVPYAQTALKKGASLCYERAKDACYVDHRPFDVLTMYLGFARQNALIGLDNLPEVNRLEKLALNCFSFDIEIDSTITITDSYSLTAKGKARLTMSDSILTPPIKEGSIKITDVKVQDMDDCTLVRIDAPESDFIVKSIFLNDIKFEQSLGVYINPISPASNAHFECQVDEHTKYPISIPGTPEPSEIFGGFYMMLHSQPTSNEFNGKKGQFEMFKWDVHYKEKFATKSYKRTVPSMELEEKTDFTIYHRPRPLK